MLNLHIVLVVEVLGCDGFFELDSTTAHEREGRVHGVRTVQGALIQASHVVHVVETHLALITVQAHPDAAGHGQDSVFRPV